MEYIYMLTEIDDSGIPIYRDEFLEKSKQNCTILTTSEYATFLEYENIPQSNTERGMTLMKLELTFSDLCQLALVIIALIELFRDRKHKKK